MPAAGPVPSDPVEVSPSGDIDETSAQALRGLFGRDSLYLILWAIQIVLAALLTPVETRLLGPSSFGVVAAAVAVMQLLVQVGSFNLQTAIARAYTRPDGEANARRLVVLAIAVAGTLLILAYTTGPYWCDAIGLRHFSTPIRYAVIWAALTAVTNATFGVLRSRDQLGWFATVAVIQSVVAEAVAVALMVFIHRTPTMYLFGQMVCQGLAVVVGLVATRPKLPRIRDLPVLGDALRFTAPLLPAAVAAFAFDVSDRLVIHADIGSAATARYAVARNIGGFAIILLSVLQNAWMPRLFALKDQAVRRTVMAASRDGIYALVACFALAITLASPVLLLIWVPASFRPSTLVLVSGLIAVSAIPAAGGQSSIRVLILNERSTMVAVTMVLGAALNLALNLAVVPWLGIYGSALSTLIAYSLMLDGCHDLPAVPVRRDRRAGVHGPVREDGRARAPGPTDCPASTAALHSVRRLRRHNGRHRHRQSGTHSAARTEQRSPNGGRRGQA
jgi:O-antigen/teichoic acid export membrane protein